MPQPRDRRPVREHGLPVRWTPSATLDLVGIVRYLKRHSPQAAQQFLTTARTKAKALTDFPHRGRVVPELARIGITHWREVVFAPHRLVYTVEDDRIEVDALVDSRRDVEDILLERLVQRSRPSP